MVDEPRADRYLVSFATLGGQYGNGAVIKYDRVTHETTSVPLGNSTPGLPLGQPLQLENGLVLGGTLNRVGAALNPQRSKVGVWTLDLTTKVMQDYALPDTDSIRNDGRWYTRAVAAPKRFAKTENGDIWAAVIYEAFDPLAPFIAGNDYSTLIAGLVAFDSETGEPSGELHLFGGSESISDANFTGVTAHGQILSFVSPALRVEDNNTTGQRMWLIDIDIRDSDGRPSSNFLLFSPDVNSIAMGAWKIPFAATADNESGNLYIMTTAVESNVEMRIHRIALGDTISSTPTLTTVISGPADGLIDLPGTPLYQASDNQFYYVMNIGKLMVFNPDTNTVIERADFSVNGLTTHVQGFIYETEEGVLVGVVSDSNPTQSFISRRAFMFNLRDQSWFTRDVTHSTSEYDSFMGVTTIVK